MINTDLLASNISIIYGGKKLPRIVSASLQQVSSAQRVVSFMGNTKFDLGILSQTGIHHILIVSYLSSATEHSIVDNLSEDPRDLKTMQIIKQVPDAPVNGINEEGSQVLFSEAFSFNPESTFSLNEVGHESVGFFLLGEPTKLNALKKIMS